MCPSSTISHLILCCQQDQDNECHDQQLPSIILKLKHTDLVKRVCAKKYYN
jgi:hypothetical protein